MSYPDTPLQGSVDSIGWALPSKTVAPAVQNECTQLSSMKGFHYVELLTCMQ